VTGAKATVRLVALDLDGTLLRSDGTVSQRTRDALSAARAAGITIVLATARPPRSLRAVAHDTGISGLALCSNGAVVYDLDHDCIVRQSTIAVGLAYQLITSLRSVLPGVAFAVEAGARYGCEPHYVIQAEHPHDAKDAAMLRDDAAALVSLGATKLIVQHPALGLDDLLVIVRQHCGELAATHSGASFVEIAPSGISKAVALQSLCENLGVLPSEVVAFGDMPNDLPMLLWAGQGVAVANAHADVLAAVDAVTATNDADGVALALEEMVALAQA
jgi:Cof subfamily protein (haloacid dehalogenase superfamily)